MGTPGAAPGAPPGMAPGAPPITGGAPGAPPGVGAPGAPPGVGAPTPSAGGGAAAAAAAAVAGAPSATQSGAPGGGAAAPGAPIESRAATNTTAPTGSSVTGAGGQAGAALNAQTVGDLLNRSSTSVGVSDQRRNTVSADPRVRGYRSTQYLTVGDGGLFLPARLDLDTAVAKFDPASLQDVIVTKGPYTALLGPGFSFLDIATLRSPRFDSFRVAGRTSGGYQTNGERYEALQSVSVGDRDWGFRGTYNILQGNDYRSGNGTRVPSSYLSNNVNFAVGFDIDPKSSIEFKGLRVFQSDLEFPGLYFDVRDLDTEAYNLRYELRDQGLFDRFRFDVWYNSTAASGDTRMGAKQAFVQKLLAVSFNPQFYTADRLQLPISALIAPPPAGLGSAASIFTDQSTTRFAARSIGYRSALTWGRDDDLFLTAGTDFNTFGQGLTENIVFTQVSGPNLNTGVQTAGNPFTFNQQQQIPNSNMVDAGVFFQTGVPVTDRLKLTSGGRLDWANASSNPRRITGNVDIFGTARGTTATPRFDLDPIVFSSNPTDGRLTRDYVLLSGFLQTEYKLDDNWTATAAVGHAQRAPTLTELYASGPFIGVLQQGTSRLIGDPNLSPEKLTQFDLGVRAEYDRFQFGVTGFYALISDYITYDANRKGFGLTQVVYTNTDRAALAGGEVFGVWDATEWLTPFASLSYVQGTDLTARDRRRPGNLESTRRDDPVSLRRKAATEPLPQIPPLESRAGLRFHAPGRDPWWQIEFSARMVSGQDNVARSLDELPTPGFTIFNVRGFLKVSEQVLLSAGVENFGDRNYREHLDPISGNLLNSGPLLRPGTNFFFNTQVTY